MVRLYIETNFLMSYASGRDPSAVRLVQDRPASVRCVMPACCIMESLSCLEDQRKLYRGRGDLYSRDAKEAARSLASPETLDLSRHLRAAQESAARAFINFETRFMEVVERFTDGMSVELLATRPGRYLAGFAVSEALDPTDQLILATILDDAGTYPEAEKALLTENRRCFFDDPEVRQAIAGAGLRYFASAGNFLQWHEAGGES